MLGVDEELKQYDGKGNIVPYLGSEELRNWAYHQKQTENDALSEEEKALFRPDIDKIINDVALMMDSPVASILDSKQGKRNIPHSVATYLCQQVGGRRLITIAKKFGLKRSGSISTTIAYLKALLESDQQLRNKLMQYYTCPFFSCFDYQANLIIEFSYIWMGVLDVFLFVWIVACFLEFQTKDYPLFENYFKFNFCENSFALLANSDNSMSSKRSFRHFV